MKSPHQHHSSSARLLIVWGAMFLVSVGLTVVAVVVAQRESRSATTPRDCPARHTASGAAYVPAGVRPCVLRTGGKPGGPWAGTNDSSSRGRDRQKQPARPAPVVKQPAVKAPAGPAVKPPPVRK
ncbi:hypothetical protein ACFCZR_24380 [Streptomyces rubiginosohelvolus]|uniref:hypothetical protein n=1 Tax=Streptomyces rubiginosohelvolus TaxID=67362 RepID=UPI0035D5DA23